MEHGKHKREKRDAAAVVFRSFCSPGMCGGRFCKNRAVDASCYSGIDWCSLLKSDLSADGLSHFTLTPSEQWVHTHTSSYTHTQGSTIPSTDTSRECSLGKTTPKVRELMNYSWIRK